MKKVSAELGATNALRRRREIALCSQCRRDILPQLKQPSRPVEAQGTARGMLKTDPRAERIKKRKDRKRAQRSYMTRGTLAAVKLTLLTKNAVTPAPPSDDCPRCIALQRKLDKAA